MKHLISTILVLGPWDFKLGLELQSWIYANIGLNLVNNQKQLYNCLLACQDHKFFKVVKGWTVLSCTVTFHFCAGNAVVCSDVHLRHFVALEIGSGRTVGRNFWVVDSIKLFRQLQGISSLRSWVERWARRYYLKVKNIRRKSSWSLDQLEDWEGYSFIHKTARTQCRGLERSF